MGGEQQPKQSRLTKRLNSLGRESARIVVLPCRWRQHATGDLAGFQNGRIMGHDRPYDPKFFAGSNRGIVAEDAWRGQTVSPANRVLLIPRPQIPVLAPRDGCNSNYGLTRI